MEIIGGLIGALFFLMCAFIWLLPILFIALSNKTDGKEKFAWILAVVFISWFAWVFYWLLAPLRKTDRYGYHQ